MGKLALTVSTKNEWAIKSLDPAAIGLDIYSYASDTGQKEVDDHFSAWNDSKFEDNTSLSSKLSTGLHIFCYFVDHRGVYTHQELMQWKSLEAYNYFEELVASDRNVAIAVRMRAVSFLALVASCIAG